MMRFVLGFMLVLGPSVAWAQQFNDVAQQLDGGQRWRGQAPAANVVRVQIAYQLQIPVDRTGLDRSLSVDDQKGAVNIAHGAIVDLVSHECDRLKGVLNGDCRLTGLTIGGGYGGNASGGASVPVSGNATFELLPAVPAQPAAKP